jgi:hypothetical protein
MQLAFFPSHDTLWVPFASFSDKYRSSKLHTLSAAVRDDLVLWILILKIIFKGISMSDLVIRQPDRHLGSDACPYGLGGYSLTTGKAWRLQIPSHLVGRGSINSLAFLACVIAIRMNNPPPESCVSSQTDNTSAESWLKSSNFHDENKANMDLPRWLGEYIMDRQICLYSEYLPGDENDTCDSLSRDFYLSNDDLISLFSSVPSLQLPQDFEICRKRSPLGPFLSGAPESRSEAVTLGTHAKQTLAFQRWVQFCKDADLSHDTFLDSFDLQERNTLHHCWLVHDGICRRRWEHHHRKDSKQRNHHSHLLPLPFRKRGTLPN